MPQSDSFTKALRLLRLMRLYEQPGQRLRTVEIADRLGVDEDTAKKYIDELDRIGWLVLDKKGHYWIRSEHARADRLFVSLSMPEAAALYLAGRLLSQIHDERNQHTILALTRIVDAMPSQLLTPLRSLVEMAEQRTQDQSDRSAVFQALTMGWVKHRQVRLRYAPAHKKKFDCFFSPYLLEPSGIGRTVYAIGKSDISGKLRTFKLERIEWAELTDQPFTIDPGFDGPTLLKRAWGVMYGENDEDLVTIRLHFTDFVTPRVRETLWHPSQKITLTRDGCDLTMQIADTLEVENWIRGWGADCEVLEPAELRESIISHTRGLMKMYGLVTQPPHNPAKFDQNLFKKGE